MGETELLTRSYQVDVQIHISPTIGDMVVLTTFPFPVSRYLFRLSGPALVSAARDLFKVVIPSMHGIHLHC